MASPDRFYVAARTGPGSLALIWDGDARPLWRPYFERAGVDPLRFQMATFEVVVEQYLEDLAAGWGPATETFHGELRTALSGLAEAIADGEVKVEVEV